MNCKSMLVAIVLVIALSNQGLAVWLNSEHGLDELNGHPIDGLRRDERTFGSCLPVEQRFKSVVCDVVNFCTEFVGTIPLFGEAGALAVGGIGQAFFGCPYIPPPPQALLFGGLIPSLPTNPQYWRDRAANLTVTVQVKLNGPNKSLMANLSISLSVFINAYMPLQSATTLPVSTTTTRTTATTKSGVFMAGFLNNFLGNNNLG